MSDPGFTERYNYDDFVPEKYTTTQSWEQSPELDVPAPSFTLWQLEDRSEIELSAVWAENKYTIVEFGSFT